MDSDQIAKDAKRYGLLRDYMLNNGFVVHEKIEQGEKPYVVDGDFYGPTFDDAVDTLEKLNGIPRPMTRAVLYEMPGRTRVGTREEEG